MDQNLLSVSRKITGHYINGEDYNADTEMVTIKSPIDGSHLGEVPVASADTVDKAVLAAKDAFGPWSETTVKDRVQVLFRFKQLVEKDILEIAEIVSSENGKTISESRAEIEKGLEVTEFATSLPQIYQQEILEVSRGVTCRSVKYPLGVVAGITPFNFPAMVPLWMIPIAIGVGNTFIHKPSEQVPLSANVIAHYLTEAGLPKGVFNVVHGDKRAVDLVLDNQDIKAIGFVGSSAVAKIVYTKGTLNNKRVLALGGAKNHLIVMPDADPEMTASNVVASAYGCAGQRCMAASVLILVGDCDAILERIVEEAKKIEAGVNMGAVISQVAKDRIEGYISRAESNGARILVDGRNTTVLNKENGTYVNPTIIDGVTTDNEAACDEIFGPVLTVLRVNTLDEALEIENNNPYGNAASIYTLDGGTANYFSDRASSGMVGVNIGVPVPREPFGFGGWNSSRFGYGDITGIESVGFWTKTKKVTSKWKANATKNWMS